MKTSHCYSTTTSTFLQCTVARVQQMLLANRAGFAEMHWVVFQWTVVCQTGLVSQGYLTVCIFLFGNLLSVSVQSTIIRIQIVHLFRFRMDTTVIVYRIPTTIFRFIIWLLWTLVVFKNCTWGCYLIRTKIIESRPMFFHVFTQTFADQLKLVLECYSLDIIFLLLAMQARLCG